MYLVGARILPTAGHIFGRNVWPPESIFLTLFARGSSDAASG